MANSKKIIFHDELRAALGVGVDKLANAVKVSLGPCGRNAIYERTWGTPLITKDGVTIAKEVFLDNELENMGAQMVKQVASQTALKAGDGTTTATVLAQAIFREGRKFVASGANAIEVKRGIDKAVECVVNAVKQRAVPVKDNKAIKQIATISANQDEAIGSLIAQAFEKVGKEGIVTVEEAKGMSDELVITDGMQFDRGYLSPHFVTNEQKSEVEFDEPYILLANYKLGSLSSIVGILDKICREGKPLVIIAEDVEGEALSTLVVNKVRGILRVAAVKAPGFGDRRKAILEDIAVLTSATIATEDTGIRLEAFGIKELGKCKRVKITKNDCTIIEGKSDQEKVTARKDIIRAQIEEATSDYDKEKLQERLAALSGCIAVIKVTASTDTEMKEKKDRIDDALSATRAAIEEGIIAGGGIALLRARHELENLELAGDQALGAKILEKALMEPFNIILRNGGYEPAAHLPAIERLEPEWGFDARANSFVNMLSEGIVDPVKVTRCALQNAASVAGLLLTTEVALYEEKDKNAPALPTPQNMY